MPWHLPEDLKHFRQLTTGHAVLMGRRTWESIWQALGRPLPNRRSIVLSRDQHFDPPGAERVDSVAQAIDRCADQGEIFVIGGGQVYAAALADCERAVVTEIDLTPEGDTTFAALDPLAWQEINRRSERSVKGIRFDIVTSIRRDRIVGGGGDSGANSGTDSGANSAGDRGTQ
jgi:dihydrofolate reductase